MSDTSDAILSWSLTILFGLFRMQHSNAVMATSSFDRIDGGRNLVNDAGGAPTTVTGPIITQPYSRFRVQTLGGNIVQGQLNKIRVAEILLPYGIPTVMDDSVNGIGPNGDGEPLSGANQVPSNNLLYLQSWTMGNGIGTGTNQTPATVVTNSFKVLALKTGFYTGTELAAVIQTAADTAMATVGIPAGIFKVAYDSTTAAIVVQNNSQFNNAASATNYFFSLTWKTLPLAGKSLGQPNLLWTMGLRDIYSRFPPVTQDIRFSPSGQAYSPILVPNEYPTGGYPGGFPGTIYPPVLPFGYGVNTMVGSTYTGAYTQYLDICSPSLCQAQYVRDGNTNQTIIRRDLIARVYIASEVSTATTDPVGTRPFTIHRQFKNAKVMKWTAERSIDSIDLTLYDQFGNQVPLLPPILGSALQLSPIIPTRLILQGQPADYAITFLVDEHDETMEHNIGYTA